MDANDNRIPGEVDVKTGNPFKSHQNMHSSTLRHKMGNPAPMGLFGYAVTSLVVSLYNARAGVSATTPQNLASGMCLFSAGFIQILAGIFELIAGNTFGATAFCSYGAFWLSLGLNLLPSSGIAQAYTSVSEYERLQASAIFSLAWAIFTFLIFIASHRTNGGVVAMFFFMFLAYLLNAIADFTQTGGARVAGGIVGILSSASAFWSAMAELLASERTSIVQLPLFSLKANEEV
ncbi:uncharacterized protein VTP21DRAFT_11382 [Calcarisporiella thermophila]|uniref:uncharacterized protein n=1 Tax=Calcarisporiella thermophila TaxID=911321 RepID=UPI00374426DF